MLMAKKRDTDNNSEDKQDLQELLKEIVGRLADLEESSQHSDASAKINLANIYFKPDNKYLPDMSFISPIAAEPLAEAMALDMMTSEKVRSGETSINMELINFWLHIQRGVRGRLMGIGKEAMQEQVSSEKQEEEMPEFEAGRE